jgi:hypothetical protein
MQKIANKTTQEKIKEEQERYYSKAARAKIPPEDFAGPNSTFPIKVQNDVYNAAKLIGHAHDPNAVKQAIIKIATRKGFSLPKAWMEEVDDTDKKESTIQSDLPIQTMNIIKVKKESAIASLKTCWLEDDAISLNGRQYPKESVDQLIRSAQLQLSDMNALPLTCYISHQKADEDNTLDIAGKIVNVWREGTKAFAQIDIPDTHTGRDIATLVNGNYIRSQSLRASGAEIKPDRNHTFPQVIGNLKLEGIDFTTSPGLSSIARITDIKMIAESTSPQCVEEIFRTDSTQFSVEEKMDIHEETIASMTTGTSVGMTNDNPTDKYSAANYHLAPTAPGDEFPQQLQDVHDRIAFVTEKACAPSMMETLQRFGEDILIEKSKLSESGSKLSANTKMHLNKAHDQLAEHMNLACMNAGGLSGDGDNDDDDKNAMGNSFSGSGMKKGDPINISNPSEKALSRYDIQEMIKQQLTPKKEQNRMNASDAIKMLQEAGYALTPPKTKEELLKEEFEVKIAEQTKKAEEQNALLLAKLEQMNVSITESKEPYALSARKSLIEATKKQNEKKPYYRNGDYIREHLSDMSFREQLLDRSRPLPEKINPEHLLKELEIELLGAYDAKFGLSS